MSAETSCFHFHDATVISYDSICCAIQGFEKKMKITTQGSGKGAIILILEPRDWPG